MKYRQDYKVEIALKIGSEEKAVELQWNCSNIKKIDK
jgi:hypothetical protein